MICLGAVAAMVMGCSGSDEGASFEVPEAWKADAFVRVQDLFHSSAPPTFGVPGRPDSIEVVEASVLLEVIDRPWSQRPSIVALLAGAESAGMDPLVVAEEFLDVAGVISEPERAALRGSLSGIDESDLFVQLSADRIRVALGDDLEPDTSCPTAAATETELYEAGARAARLGMRAVTCSDVGPLPLLPAGSGLTAELIEYVRAAKSLASIGAADPVVADEASRALIAAVEESFSTEELSRSFAQLLHHAWTAEPAIGSTLASHAEDMTYRLGRTIRWSGSLADSAEGIDFPATAMALRVVSELDPEAADALYDGWFSSAGAAPAAPVGYQIFVDVALGRFSESDIDASVVEGLPPMSIALPLMAEYGECAALGELSELSATSGMRDPKVLQGLAGYSRRCAVDGADRIGEPPEQVADQSIRSCLQDGTVATGQRTAAAQELAAKSWDWPQGVIPDLADIYERLVLMSLQDGSCTGYWWFPTGNGS